MDDSGRILPNVTNGEMIEYEINAYIQKIRREYLKLGQERTQFMSCKDLKEEIEKSLAPDAEFIDFVEFAQNIVIQTKKKKTAEWYRSSIDTLCWYTKRKKIDIKLITSFLLNKMIKDLYHSGLVSKRRPPPSKPSFLPLMSSSFRMGADLVMTQSPTG